MASKRVGCSPFLPTTESDSYRERASFRERESVRELQTQRERDRERERERDRKRCCVLASEISLEAQCPRDDVIVMM